LLSPLRLQILHDNGAMNVNDIRVALGLPQSTIATNIIALEDSGLITTKTIKGKRGQQEICSARFSKILVRFANAPATTASELVEVAMPPGLYTSCEVAAPCGLCSSSEVIGLLDLPIPSSIRAAWKRRWCGSGGLRRVQVPEQRTAVADGARVYRAVARARLGGARQRAGLAVGHHAVDQRCEDRHLDLRRPRQAPWSVHAALVEDRKLQFGELKTWAIDGAGSYLDGTRTSDVTLPIFRSGIIARFGRGSASRSGPASTSLAKALATMIRTS